MAVTLPAKVSERGIKADHARAINQLIEVVRKIQLVAGPGQQITQTPNGTTLKIEPSRVISTTSEQSWFY